MSRETQREVENESEKETFLMVEYGPIGAVNPPHGGYEEAGTALNERKQT